jgi:DNA polymerase III epsilon subunit-like protein
MSLVHLNQNVLAVIDTETTGPDPDKHDILEVSVLVLDRFLKPDKTILPFNIFMAPQRLGDIDMEALRIQGKTMDDIVKEKVCKQREEMVELAGKGLHPDSGADLFESWFRKLKLPPRKRIMPIACNWPFDREFIRRWLGIDGFYHYFDPRFRDVMSMSLYDNDIADWRGDTFPYNKNNLQWLCTVLGIERTRSHTALDDCVATAEVFRRMVQRTEIRNLPRAPEGE